MLKVYHFKDDHYSVLFDDVSGLFIRKEDHGFDDPKFSTHGPELLDVSITNWCDKECSFCYRFASKNGIHIKKTDYVRILEEAKSAHVFQIALGGGNPNQHPEFSDILKITRENYGIVPNYTTNGRGLSDYVIGASKEYCGAVALSYYAPSEDFTNAIKRLSDADIKTNIHFILTLESIENAISLLKNPPSSFRNINAIIFLNYKPAGRNSNEKLLLRKSNKLKEFFELATIQSFDFKIGFDSCSITGLAKWGTLNELAIDPCDAARFSAFISEDMKVYPCSFMVNFCKGISLNEFSLLEIWNNSALFSQFRKTHLKRNCTLCKMVDICEGGCHLLEIINLCDHEPR